MLDKHILINANHEQKLQVWLPHKTGSNTIRFILNHFDFYVHVYNLDRGTENVYNYLNGANNTDISEKYQDYQLICSVRNPYERFISFSYFFNELNPKIAIELDEFDRSVNRVRGIIQNEPESFRLKKPDFFIRTENIFEDLLNLEFIRESKLNKCGLLEEITNKKFNNSKKPIDWKSLYNQERADKVYYLFEHIFELGIYDRQSWR